MENINTSAEEINEVKSEDNNTEVSEDTAAVDNEPAVNAEAPDEAASTDETVAPVDNTEATDDVAAIDENAAPADNPEEQDDSTATDETAVPSDNPAVPDEAASTDENVALSDKTEEQDQSEEKSSKPEDPAAAIEAILFATGNSVKIERLSDVLGLSDEEVHAAIAVLKERYEGADRGICLTELEDAVQLGTKGEYYEYLIKLAKSPKRMTLSDTVIETLSIIAYKQPVTRAEIERIRGVSCDHAINRLLEYELVEEVGRLDAPGKPLLFGTTEQFLRSFGVRSIQDLPVMSPEMMQDFKAQAEAEAEEDLKVNVDV